MKYYDIKNIYYDGNYDIYIIMILNETLIMILLNNH